MINKQTTLTFGEFLAVQDCIANPDEIYEQVKAMSMPVEIKGKEIPKDLNNLTYGDFITLAQAGEGIFVECFRIILGLDAMGVRCDLVLRFGQFVAEELARIGQLFASTAIEPTAEEKEAGIKDLNAGFFGTIDWYAQRMHISHDEVTKTSWVIIYKCLDMEARRVRFNRRLREVQQRHAKQKHK